MNVHKIVWQEGMLLRPQHLQHNDRYYDNQMKARTQLLGSYNWGFLALELDRQFLNMGKLVISQASGVLPDGSLFELGGNTEPLALDVPPNTSNVPIYLALPLVTGNHIEARRPEQAEVLARYTAYDLEVADSNAGEDSMVQVSCARPDFRLLLGEQQSDQAYVKLKVAVVLDTTPDGVISLDPDFVPSYLHAHASAYLLSCLKEVISMLGHRGDTIAERIRSNGKVGGAEVGDFMMLQLINRTELLLRHYLGLEQVHPEQLYRVLLTMLGDLATFGSESKRPRLDSRYQHSDQGASFRRLMEAIRQVLSMVLEQHAIELPLQARQYGILVSPCTTTSCSAAPRSCSPPVPIASRRNCASGCPRISRWVRSSTFANWSTCTCRGSGSSRCRWRRGRSRSTPTRPISFSNPTPRTWPSWSAPAVSRSTYPASSPSLN